MASDERSPLLGQPVAPRTARRLYVSHFLSTWNSRVFEFGAVLYLAAVFPGSLLPMSAYALTRGLCAIVLAPAIGHFIDTANRLAVVRLSIVLQRLAVAASCAVFLVAATRPLGRAERAAVLVLVSLLACVEKACSMTNLISVEKDWVVVVAGEDPDALRAVNAQMRRIDLLCKLLGPLFIALVDGLSTRVAMVVNLAMNAASVLVEYVAIARVYDDVPELRVPKQTASPELPDAGSSGTPERSRLQPRRRVRGLLAKSAADLRLYVRHAVFLPSAAGALLYLTVLSFGGQMVTYLLAAGYSLTQVGIARTLSVVCEVATTWLAPWLMGSVGPVRAGLWLSSWQVAMLAAGVAVFWGLDNKPLVSATGLVVGTILSRVGLRGFDLCVQLIVQEDVEAESRGAFSSVEAAWQNAFEILAYASTVVFSRPDQFKWPSLVSTAAVGSAYAAYAVFVYRRRGHLLHLEALTTFLSSGKGKRRQRERCLDRIASCVDV